jgi:chemotaxis phosphatase CheX-like protein
MSSPILLALADCHEPLLAALAEVAENSLFAFADMSDQAAFGATAAPLAEGGEEWLHATIVFKGSIAGRFALTIPAPLSRRLCASFAGADSADEISDEDLLDFSGELANMICGAWLTHAVPHEVFNLQAPKVVSAEPVPVVSNAASEHVYLAIDDVPVRLDLSWEPAASGSDADNGR